MRISPREKESCKIVSAADPKSDDDVGSVETHAGYENWSVQDSERRTNNLVQDKK